MSYGRPDSHTYSDAEYLSGIHRGDERAFTALVNQYLPSLTRYAFALTRDDIAHDIVQDVFARIWAQGINWRPAGSISAYLFTAVRHRALDALKAGHANDRMRDAVRMETLHTQDTRVVYRDTALAESVRRAIVALTDRQRDAVRLRYDFGHSVPEVAEILGINVTAAEKLLARALVTLRDQLVRTREELKEL